MLAGPCCSWRSRTASPPQPLDPAGSTTIAELVIVDAEVEGRRVDDYLADVDTDDIAHLWPCGSLIDAGIPVAAGSDAPYGPTDPWLAMATARSRLTRAGHVLGAREAVEGPRRRVEVGEPADLWPARSPVERGALGAVA